ATAHPRTLPSFPTRRSSDLRQCRACEEPLISCSIETTHGEDMSTWLRFPSIAVALAAVSSLTACASSTPGSRRPLAPTIAVEYGDRKSTRLNSSHVAISYAV